MHYSTIKSFSAISFNCKCGLCNYFIIYHRKILKLFAVGIIIQFLVTNLQHKKDIIYVGDWSELPLFFGTVIFAFEGIAVVG